jgi:hypothetical protein
LRASKDRILGQHRDRRAYAGVTFALVMATISAYFVGEVWAMPLVLLVLVGVSYSTRPAGRRVSPATA